MKIYVNINLFGKEKLYRFKKGSFEKKSTIIVGAGVSGVFADITLLENGIKGENITLIDKGNHIEKRHCFVSDTQSYKRRIRSFI